MLFPLFPRSTRIDGRTRQVSKMSFRWSVFSWLTRGGGGGGEWQENTQCGTRREKTKTRLEESSREVRTYALSISSRTFHMFIMLRCHCATSLSRYDRHLRRAVFSRRDRYQQHVAENVHQMFPGASDVLRRPRGTSPGGSHVIPSTFAWHLAAVTGVPVIAIALWP